MFPFEDIGHSDGGSCWPYILAPDGNIDRRIRIFEKSLFVRERREKCVPRYLSSMLD
jgi:hypothetical protein